MSKEDLPVTKRLLEPDQPFDVDLWLAQERPELEIISSLVGNNTEDERMDLFVGPLDLLDDDVFERALAILLVELNDSWCLEAREIKFLRESFIYIRAQSIDMGLRRVGLKLSLLRTGDIKHALVAPDQK